MQGLQVFASASLTEAFEALAAAYAAERDAPLPVLHFAGTPQLLVQLREGAEADVLATADPQSMARVAASGRLDGDARTFASNRLAIVVAAGNPHAIAGLADLARPELLVALCGPEVPAGRYARAALDEAGVQVASRSDEPSVKALLAKVELGELDAAVVYVTDLQAAAARVTGIPLPELDVAIHYPVARLVGADPRAAEFLEFLFSPAGTALLQAHGFAAP